MKLSNFANHFSAESGIVQLMEDLGNAMASDDDVLMMGGGNPAHIPEVQSYFQQRLQWLADNPQVMAQAIGNYDAPRGEQEFIHILTEFFRNQYGWPLKPENIVLTNGSQTGFFLLFNSLGGQYGDGNHKKILFPMVPEYIGYTDVGLEDGMFKANKPAIDKFSDRTFKYHVDFKHLDVNEDIGAICVSRPTNPTGNVLTDIEIEHLQELSIGNDIPLIIDNAYGMPFPNIIFSEATLSWSENTVLCMSLSKLGLPAVRTGVIIAHEDITATITRMNGVISLALSSIGPVLVSDLIRSGEVIKLSQNSIKPFYQAKAKWAMDLVHRELNGLDYYIHKAEGAIFLWLWFPELPISSEELYQRLKQRGVLIISGHHFFPGLQEDWQHKYECIRVTYAMDDDIVSQGIKIIAEELRKIYK